MRKLAAAAGLAGPLLFATVLIVLTFVEYPFMRSLGWDPIMHPTFDWPSGLALGPIGWIMTLTFLVSGALMSTFASGLRGELTDRNGRTGTFLLTGAGVAMMGLAFSTDRVITPLPISWHGWLHDLSFMVLGLLIIAAMGMLALSFSGRNPWRTLVPFTWIIFLLAVPAFAVKGFALYGFLAAILLWNGAAAVRLLRVGYSAQGAQEDRASRFLAEVTVWARGKPDILAAALVGSHARGAAKPASDIDLVLVCANPRKYLSEVTWLSEFGSVVRRQTENYRKLTSIRVWYSDGLEVEYGITGPDWAAVPPDEGTWQVICDGMKVLLERGDVLSRHQRLFGAGKPRA